MSKQNGIISVDETEFVLVIPVSSCSTCVSQAATFASKYETQFPNLLIIFTEFRSTKELNVRFKLEASENILFDKNGDLNTYGLDFPNVGFYEMTNSEIIDKKILNSSNVRDYLNLISEKLRDNGNLSIWYHE